MEQKQDYEAKTVKVEYNFTMDVMVTLPAYMNAGELFNRIHDAFVSAITNSYGSMSGNWDWKEYKDETETLDNQEQ